MKPYSLEPDRKNFVSVSPYKPNIYLYNIYSFLSFNNSKYSQL